MYYSLSIQLNSKISDLNPKLTAIQAYRHEDGNFVLFQLKLTLCKVVIKDGAPVNA